MTAPDDALARAVANDEQTVGDAGASTPSPAVQELAMHATNSTYTGCVCGWQSPDWTEWTYLEHAASRVLAVALTLAEHDRQVAERTLREAAEALDAAQHRTMRFSENGTIAWLSARADALRDGTP